MIFDILAFGLAVGVFFISFTYMEFRHGWEEYEVIIYPINIYGISGMGGGGVVCILTIKL